MEKGSTEGSDGSVRRAQRLAQQERNFLALISHELKTPLAVVRSLADNLARGIGTDEGRAREYGVVLQEESERLGQRIRNVLGLTSLQGGIPLWDRCPVDPAAVDHLIGTAFRHGASGPGPHHIAVSVVPRRWGSRAQEGQVPGGGAGLSLVRATAEALGGPRRWSSREGKGARFSLWLREALP